MEHKSIYEHTFCHLEDSLQVREMLLLMDILKFAHILSGVYV